MKLAIIDTAYLYNDLLYMLLSNPVNLRQNHYDDKSVYIGKPPTYSVILRDLTTYVHKFLEDDTYCIGLHVLIAPETPRFNLFHVILPKLQLHEHIVKALRASCKDDFAPISIRCHEYNNEKTKSEIINNLQLMIGPENCLLVKPQHPIITL